MDDCFTNPGRKHDSTEPNNVYDNNAPRVRMQTEPTKQLSTHTRKGIMLRFNNIQISKLIHYV